MKTGIQSIDKSRNEEEENRRGYNDITKRVHHFLMLLLHAMHYKYIHIIYFCLPRISLLLCFSFDSLPPSVTIPHSQTHTHEEKKTNRR